MDEYTLCLSGAFARVLTDPFLAEICAEVDRDLAFSAACPTMKEDNQ